jgi:hypothetical protein
MSVFSKKSHGGGGVYLSPMWGNFHQKVDEGTEGAVSRENKNKETVWELIHEAVTGHISNAYVKKGGKFGNQFYIIVKDKESGNSACIQIGVSSSYCRKFLMVAGNIDWRAPVSFEPYHFADKKKKNKMITGWSIVQNGHKVEDFLTKEMVPELEQKETVKGTVWDDTKALEFLFKKWLKVADRQNFAEPTGNAEEDDGDDEDETPPAKTKPREEPSSKRKRAVEAEEEDEEEEGPSF